MEKDLVKKLRELDSALTDCVVSAIIAFSFFLGLGFAAYFFGFPAGIYWLVGATIGTIAFFRTREEPIDPFWISRGLAWHIISYEDKEFSKRAAEYVKNASSKYNPWPLTLVSYLIVIVMMILSPNSAPLDNLLAAVLGLIYFGPVLISHDAARLLMARNPRKISEFFGVPEKKWRVDLIPAKVPRSIMGVALAFYIIATFIFGSALIAVISKLTNSPLLFFQPTDPVFVIIGVAMVGSFCWATGHYLRKMRKEGAAIAIIMLSFALFIEVGIFIIAPLTGGVGPPFYYAPIAFAGTLAAIYFIKRNLRKFK